VVVDAVGLDDAHRERLRILEQRVGVLLQHAVKVEAKRKLKLALALVEREAGGHRAIAAAKDVQRRRGAQVVAGEALDVRHEAVRVPAAARRLQRDVALGREEERAEALLHRVDADVALNQMHHERGARTPHLVEQQLDGVDAARRVERRRRPKRAVVVARVRGALQLRQLEAQLVEPKRRHQREPRHVRGEAVEQPRVAPGRRRQQTAKVLAHHRLREQAARAHRHLDVRLVVQQLGRADGERGVRRDLGVRLVDKHLLVVAVRQRRAQKLVEKVERRRDAARRLAQQRAVPRQTKMRHRRRARRIDERHKRADGKANVARQRRRAELVGEKLALLVGRQLVPPQVADTDRHAVGRHIELNLPRQMVDERVKARHPAARESMVRLGEHTRLALGKRAIRLHKVETAERLVQRILDANDNGAN
jgi:hypothetical protein